MSICSSAWARDCTSAHNTTELETAAVHTTIPPGWRLQQRTQQYHQGWRLQQRTQQYHRHRARDCNSAHNNITRLETAAVHTTISPGWRPYQQISAHGYTTELSPVHGSCCRADCCCLLLKKRANQSASSSGGKGMWGGRRCMTSYFCCLLLSLLTGKSVSPTAGGETGARGDSD